MGLNSSSGTAAPHHTSHENGGSDEIDATGLTGVGGGGGASPVAQTSVTRSSTQTISTGTLTAVSFNQENRDDDGNWAVSPNPTRVTISQDDTYDLVAQVIWYSSDLSGTFRKLGLYKNGVLLHEYSHAPSSFMIETVVDYGVSLVNGDYVELKVTQDSGSSIPVGATSTFLVVSRGGSGEFLPVDVFKTLTGDSPYGFAEKYADGVNENARINLPGSGNIFLSTRDATGAASEIDLSGGQIFIYNDQEIFLEPGTVVVMDSGDGLVLPAMSSDPTAYDQGHMYYNSQTHRVRLARKGDGFTSVWGDLVAQGNAPFAFPFGYVPNGTYSTAVNLAANGGSMAIPIRVPAPMMLSDVSIFNTDTTLAREFEMNLYIDKWTSATAVQVEGNSGGSATNFGSWTASGASIQSASYGTSNPVKLEAGVVWLVIRNTHATNTLGIGTLAAAGTFSALNAHQTKTVGSFLDTTLDLVTGWSKATGIPGVVLRGRVLNDTSAW